MEINEACDNGNKTGCINCIVKEGYKCTQVQGYPSTCEIVIVCGDSIRTSNELCDNGNKTGCINCAVDNGYVCAGEVGVKSTCTKLCGNKYVEVGE